MLQNHCAPNLRGITLCLNMGVFTTSCFSVICFVSALAQNNNATFNIVKGVKVVDGTKIIRSVSQIDCAASCLKLAGNGECKVAGYNSGSRECHISSHTLATAVANATDEWKILIPEIGKWEYYFTYLAAL